MSSTWLTFTSRSSIAVARISSRARTSGQSRSATSRQARSAPMPRLEFPGFDGQLASLPDAEVYKSIG